MTLPAILITGGATRIGAQIATAFADRGWHVVIHYRSSADAAKELAARLASARTVHCDLADDGARSAMMRALADELTDWRCLINSASVFRYDDADRLDPAIYREAMDVNALAPMMAAQDYFAGATSAGVRCVVQVTDMKLVNPNPDFASYTMSKHALSATIPVLAMARGAAGQQSDPASDHGDRVYGIAPGAILPSHDQDPEETEISHRLNLLRRKTGPDEIADAALFLSSGALKSGSTLFIDSGQHLLSQDRDVIWLAREMAGSAA